MFEAKLCCSQPKTPLASLFGTKVLLLKIKCQIRGVGKEAFVCEVLNKNMTVLYSCPLHVAITIECIAKVVGVAGTFYTMTLVGVTGC